MKSTVNAVSRGLPEVSVPILRVSGIEKAFYTAGAVAIFIWATQVRLYGVRADSTADPLYLVNAALGASGGSIMSLGVLPIILAKFFAQIGLGCGSLVTFLQGRPATPFSPSSGAASMPRSRTSASCSTPTRNS